MEIPEDLRNFLNLEKVEARIDVASLLTDPTKKGDLINFANLAEEELDRYFSRHSQAVKSGATFADKITLAETVLLRVQSNTNLHKPHLEFLQMLRKLRNKGAHRVGPDLNTAEELADDQPSRHSQGFFQVMDGRR